VRAIVWNVRGAQTEGTGDTGKDCFVTHRPALALVMLLLWQGAGALPALAQTGTRHALLIQGASGEEQYATMHRAWLDALADALRDRFGYESGHVTVLAEQPRATEARSTAENVRAAVARLAASLTPNDQLLIVLIGHGAGQGDDAKFNLIGPDLSVSDWSAILKPVRATLALVDTTSSSFPYLEGLAGPGRVIVTATNSYAQRYHTVFPDGFVRALTDDDADQDKNGRLSVLEAFTYASRLVREHYGQKGTRATEVALIDDTGDGKGRMATAESPPNSPAALLYLNGPRVATSADPETQKLLVRQEELTERIDDLRRRQSTMAPEEFQRQLEALLTELAEVSREVRRRSGGG
jgi:hypothetical protein